MSKILLPFDEVGRFLFTSSLFSKYVWYLGKTWLNPSLPLDHRGEMSLWSLTRNGEGTGADPTKVRNCTSEEESAIEYFLTLRQSTP